MWETVEEWVKKGRAGEVKWVRMRDRPAGFLRSLRWGAWAAVGANGAAVIVAALIGGGGVSRGGLWVITGLLGTGAVLAAISLLMYGRAVHRQASRRRWALAGEWVLQIGAGAYVSLLASMMLLAGGGPGSRRWPGADDPVMMGLWGLAMVVILAGGLRLALMQWWLRVEGRSWVAWPLIGTMVPVGFLLFVTALNFKYVMRLPDVGPIDYLVLQVTLHVPLPTNGWPYSVGDFWKDVIRSDRADGEPIVWVYAAVLGVGQLWVILSDGMLGWLAGRELKRRKGVGGE